MKKVAKFSKVSFEQFKEDFRKCFPEETEWLVNDDKLQEIHKAIPLPERGTSGSAGYDFASPIKFSLSPGETMKFPTGIRCKINEGWVLMIHPRSSLGFKYRLQLDNTTGVIDSDYFDADNEGDIHMKLTNDSRDGKVIQVEKGDKLAQGILMPYGITYDDDVNKVRIGGLGSTGT